MLLQLAGSLNETNDQITGFLQVKRAPTGPRQPSLTAMEKERSRGRALESTEELPREGVMAALEDREWGLLLKNTVGRSFDAGEVICLQGENARAAYLLVRGAIDVLRTVEGTTYRFARLEAGSFLGQQALLQDGVRTATLRAATQDTVVLGLSRQNFEALLHAETSLAVHFQDLVVRAGIRQLRQANELIGYLGVREGKRAIPTLGGRMLRVQAKGRAKKQAKKQEKTNTKPEAPSRPKLDPALEEISDVEALAAVYLETALQDWDVAASELKGIRVVHHDGQMSAAEKKLRQKFKK
jgi:CRP-like cAMP-binding protein